MEKRKKILKHVLTFSLIAITLVSTLITPISAVSGGYYYGNDEYFNSTFNTTSGVINPVCKSSLLLTSFNGYIDTPNDVGEILTVGDALNGNDFMCIDGVWQYNSPITSYKETFTGMTSALPDKKGFDYSFNGVNTSMYYTPFIYTMQGAETAGRNKYACLALNRRDAGVYHYLSKRGDGAFGFRYPRYMSVYSGDFLITGEQLLRFNNDNGYFGFEQRALPDNVYTSGTFYASIEFINLETGEEHTLTRSGAIGSTRNYEQNSNRLPLLTTGFVNQLVDNELFGLANTIYVKNVYTNYDFNVEYISEDNALEAETIRAYSGYLMGTNQTIFGTAFDSTESDPWNVAMTDELMPEIMASRQRYLTSFAHKDGQSYTNFVGNALKGVFEPKIFGTFGIGDVMGMLIAFGVVMGFLKYFAGG